MYKIGMYGGSFNPLHLGHVNAIIEASNQCEKLYVVLSNTNDPKEIDHKERLMWLKSITKDMDNVEVFEIFDITKELETVTVNGWISSELKSLPMRGTKLDVENLHIEVIKMKGKRIDSIKVTVQPKEETEE